MKSKQLCVGVMAAVCQTLRISRSLCLLWSRHLTVPRVPMSSSWCYWTPFCVPVVLRCLDVWASASSLVRRSVVCAVPLSWCRGDFVSWIPVCQVTCLSVQVSRLSLVSLCPGFAGLPLFLRLSVLIYQLRGLISTSHCFGVRAVPWNSALGVCRLSRFDDVASER